MVSSAIYRYVDSRDDLLTRLIVESYNSLGDATEAAVAASADRPAADRWVAAALAIRDWALARPHEYMTDPDARDWANDAAPVARAG